MNFSHWRVPNFLFLFFLLWTMLPHAASALSGEFTFYVYDVKEKKELRLLKAADLFPEKSAYHLLARPNGKVHRVEFEIECASETKTVSNPPYSIAPPPVMDMCTIVVYGKSDTGDVLLTDRIVLTTNKDVTAVDASDMDWSKSDVFYGYALKKDKLGNIQSEVSAIPENIMGEVAAKQLERRHLSISHMASEYDNECKYLGNCSTFGPSPITLDGGKHSRRIQKQSDSPIADFNTGNFETTCSVSHYAYVDPLRMSTSTGSNLNMFWGTTIPPAASVVDQEGLVAKGTCRGGTEDMSSYWAPAMLDAEGAIVVPKDIRVNYSVDYNYHAAEEVYTIPNQFAMTTGFPNALFPMGLGLGNFKCDEKMDSGIPLCKKGELEMQVNFLYCWNGVREKNKDQRVFLERAEKEEDHKLTPECPSSHPYVLPRITYTITYEIPKEGTKGWRLSSDRYASAKTSGGYSVYGGYIDGWNTVTKKAWMDNCVRDGNVCLRGKLGNGMQLSH